MRRLAVVCAIFSALVLSVIGAGVSVSDIQRGAGRPGAVASPSGARCDYLRTARSGFLRVTSSSPRVYARNINRGLGNDAMNVRYRAALSVVGAGAREVASTGWSAWKRADDRVGVVWPGVDALTASWQSTVRLVHVVEFWNVRGGLSGTVVSFQNRYQLFNQKIGPYGPYASCAKANLNR